MPVSVVGAITITNTAIVLMTGDGEDVLVRLTWVRPVTASSVITAPLCGRVSMPPEAIEATRWKTSSGMPAALALAMKVSDIAASAMPMPPEAEPVMPASDGDGDRLVDQRIGNGAEGIGDHQEARQGGNDGAETVLGSGVHRRQQRAADRRLGAFGELGHTVCQAKTKTVSDAHQQRAFDRPDGGDALVCCTTGATLPITAGMKETFSP
jgi:hypothetical protein